MNSEPETAMIPFPAAEADLPAGKGGYELSRFNAVQHGIRHTVLAHEDDAEYADLLTALAAEHQPGGATEMHLEAVKKLFAGDRQSIMNMRSWHHEKRTFAVP